MKKMFLGLKAVLLALFALILPLAADTAPKKLVITALAYGMETNPDGLAWIRAVERFERENPDIEIRYDLRYDESYHQAVLAGLQKGGDYIPDIAGLVGDARWVGPWREAGQQFDHRPYLDANYFDLNLVPAPGPNKEIWGIPFGTANIGSVLYMNEPLVKSLGFSAPKTYQDLKAMVPKAKAAGLQVISIDGEDGWAWGTCVLSCIIGRFSGDAQWGTKAVAGAKRFTDRTFIDALRMLETMVKDGVIAPNSTDVDYGTNLETFGSQKALFMVQGQWAAGSIDQAVQDKTLMLPWPAFPGEKSSMAGSVSLLPYNGYGLTKKGGSNARVREAGLKFLQYYLNDRDVVSERLRDGYIVAPLLKNYAVPKDMPPIVARKVELSRKATGTEFLDAAMDYSSLATTTLNEGLQKIVSGAATPEEVAESVESIVDRKTKKIWLEESVSDEYLPNYRGATDDYGDDPEYREEYEYEDEYEEEESGPLFDSWTTSKKTVIKALAYGNEANEEGQNWIRIVRKFEKENPDIDIQYSLLYDEAYHVKVASVLSRGGDAVPDMAYMGADARWGKPWQEANQQFDHRPFLDDQYYNVKLIPPMGPKGEIYEIPLGTPIICTVLYMNYALVRSLGFTAPKTYQDIKAMVPKAKAAGLQVVSIDGADSWAWGTCLLSCIIGRMSGDPHYVQKSVAGDVRFDSPVWIAAFRMVKIMIDDGVISAKSVGVDYGTNIANFSNKKALFFVQGQWSYGSIDREVQDVTRMLAWPAFPGERTSMSGSVAAAIQVGYGLSRKGGENPRVRDAVLKFLRYCFYSEPEVTQRLRDGAIVTPILQDYTVPADFPPIIKEKVRLAKTAAYTDVIDAYLVGDANIVLNGRIYDMVQGKATPEEVAAEVESLVDRY